MLFLLSGPNPDISVSNLLGSIDAEVEAEEADRSDRRKWDWKRANDHDHATVLVHFVDATVCLVIHSRGSIPVSGCYHTGY